MRAPVFTKCPMGLTGAPKDQRPYRLVPIHRHLFGEHVADAPQTTKTLYCLVPIDRHLFGEDFPTASSQSTGTCSVRTLYCLRTTTLFGGPNPPTQKPYRLVPIHRHLFGEDVAASRPWLDSPGGIG